MRRWELLAVIVAALMVAGLLAGCLGGGGGEKEGAPSGAKPRAGAGPGAPAGGPPRPPGPGPGGMPGAGPMAGGPGGPMGAGPMGGPPRAGGPMGGPMGMGAPEAGAPAAGPPGMPSMGKAEEAAEAAEQGEEVEAAENAWAAVEDGLSLKEAGDYEAAEKKFRAAIAADENNALAHWGLGSVLVELGKAKDDKALLREAAEELQTYVKLATKEQQATRERLRQAQRALRQLGVKTAGPRRRRARRAVPKPAPQPPWVEQIIDSTTGAAVTYELQTPGVPPGTGK